MLHGSSFPFQLDYTGFGILIFGYGKDSVRSDMAYPILYLVSFLDAADTKPIEQQFWKERLEQSVKHKYFATQIRHGDSAY